MMVNLSYYRFFFKCPQMRLFCSSSLYRKFKTRFTSKHRRKTSPELHELKNNFWIDCRWKQRLDDQETKVRHTTIYGLTLNPTFIVYFFLILCKALVSFIVLSLTIQYEGETWYESWPGTPEQSVRKQKKDYT